MPKQSKADQNAQADLYIRAAHLYFDSTKKTAPVNHAATASRTSGTGAHPGSQSHAEKVIAAAKTAAGLDANGRPVTDHEGRQLARKLHEDRVARTGGHGKGNPNHDAKGRFS